MEIYEKDSWTNPNYNYLFNKTICEYDIEAAGLNLAIKYKFLPEIVCEHLKSLPKEKRVVEMGIMERDNKDLKQSLKNAFVDIRRLFFESNGLEMYDLISIKKDAVFTCRKCEFTTFDNVVFRLKHEYSSMMRIKTMEFYYGKTNSETLDGIDIKGMSDKEAKYFEETILHCIRQVFRLKESGVPEDAIVFMRKILDAYKAKKLPIEYYREFRPGGIFRMLNQRDETEYLDFPEERIDEVDISYNFLNVLVPISLMCV